MNRPARESGSAGRCRPGPRAPVTSWPAEAAAGKGKRQRNDGQRKEAREHAGGSGRAAGRAGTEELRWRAGEVFGWIARGELDVRIGGTYPLADAARAQEDLAARRTTGKLLLLPGL